MKGKILEILRKNNDSILSGETLSKMLGVSRVTVWKHIKKLQQLGYEITSSGNGYQLTGMPDAVYPWEFPERESTIFYEAVVDSTMTLAKQLASKGCPHFSIVIADHQESGRGRLSRQWHSTGGGLFFTIVLRPEIPPPLMSRYGFAASLVIARGLREQFNIEAMVKWPNDILVNEKKICGMLSEMEVSDEQVAFLNIGIGINVNNDPTGYEPNSTSISSLLGRKVPRKAVLSNFLDAFEQQIEPENLARTMTDWKDYTITLGRDVKVVTVNDTLSGRAVDIDDTGALILELPDKSREKVFYGDCFHQTDSI